MLKDLFPALVALLAVRGLVSLVVAALLFFLRPKTGRALLCFDLRGVRDPETELRRLLCELRLLGVWGRLPVAVKNAPPELQAAFAEEKNLLFPDESDE